MIKLETLGGESLTRILKEVSPIRYVSNKQVNRLLDGSYHVQIMGSPLKIIEGTLISSYNQADKLNWLVDRGTPLLFTFLDKKYLVYFEEQLQWQRHNFSNGDKNKSFFEARAMMVIKEEVMT